MQSPPNILIYGRDILLLQTRGIVLRHAGFDVSMVSALDEAVNIIDSDPIDLFILCHTLTEEECRSILISLRSRHPTLKTLLLNAPGSGCESNEDEVLRGFASPTLLIRTICQMLNMTSISERELLPVAL